MKGFQRRIPLDKENGKFPLLIGLLQPFKGAVFFAQRGVDGGDAVVIATAAAENLFALRDDALGLDAKAFARVGDAQSDCGVAESSEINLFHVLRNRLVISPLRVQYHCQIAASYN